MQQRPTAALQPDHVPALVEAAVNELLLFKDRRTFFDRVTRTFTETYVYRVNRRHPLVRGAFD